MSNHPNYRQKDGGPVGRGVLLHGQTKEGDLSGVQQHRILRQLGAGAAKRFRRGLGIDNGDVRRTGVRDARPP